MAHNIELLYSEPWRKPRISRVIFTLKAKHARSVFDSYHWMSFPYCNLHKDANLPWRIFEHLWSWGHDQLFHSLRTICIGDSQLCNPEIFMQGIPTTEWFLLSKSMQVEISSQPPFCFTQSSDSDWPIRTQLRLKSHSETASTLDGNRQATGISLSPLQLPLSWDSKDTHATCSQHVVTIARCLG